LQRHALALPTLASAPVHFGGVEISEPRLPLADYKVETATFQALPCLYCLFKRIYLPF
jgi:hypothetical protein